MIFGIGTDIIEVARIEEKLARTKGLKTKLFTEREIGYCESKRRSGPHFAARFAAKEAFLKALGTGWRGGFQFDEVEIVNDRLGKPEVVTYGKIKEFCLEKGISSAFVSLSHIKDLAKAVVVLERE